MTEKEHAFMLRIISEMRKEGFGYGSMLRISRGLKAKLEDLRKVKR